MTFNQILSNYNVDGEVYRCDVKRFFGWDLPEEKVDEIHSALMKMKKELKGAL